MSIIDNIVSSATPDGDDDQNLEGGDFASEYPALMEFLSRRRYQGQDRQVGRVIIYTEPGKGCVCLSDKQTRQVTFHVADSIDEALKGIDRRLADGKCDWRKDKRARYGQ